MSAKLVVHKLESNNYIRSLQIAINDNGNGTYEVRYGEWSEVDNAQQKKTDVEKSSRLIVKIVSGTENNTIDLDSCAKEVENTDEYYNNSSEVINSYEGAEDSQYYKDNDNESTFYTTYYDKPSDPLITNIGENPRDINGEDLSPLEYSLEKVKENNARIMENIHMLNRTLSYTKKKEILDIVCPKSMRYPCNTCGKCFVYETGLKRHYSMRHSISDMQPRWQIVWTCIECFQVWPRQDLAVKHSTQCCKMATEECVREIKTSSLLQCEFCEKVYTSIPRLLRHSNVHTTASNYECNACESSFQSYKAAEQHWLLCPWLKMCYSFCLPKMLLCNACDRKFKSYEQLYNHRYKVGHFMTKTHCNRSGMKSFDLLVYQCEVCGQWFPAKSPLQEHRSQHHLIPDTIGPIQQYYSNNYK